MNSGPVLTRADLPTLRRLVAHYTARAAHRGWRGRIACHVMAKVCARTVDVIERHGAMRPEIDYHALDAKETP